MALSHPFFRTGNWWNDTTLGRIFDQDFGLGALENDPFFQSVWNWPSGWPYWLRPRNAPLVPNLERGISEVRNDPDKFTVNIDVSHFAPEEIKVRVVDNNLIIDAKHEEKMDQHGFVSRCFSRRYILPNEIDQQRLTSNLSPSGVLRVEAPKLVIEVTAAKERSIPIQCAGKLSPKSEQQQQKMD